MVLVRELPSLRIELACSPLWQGGTRRIPGLSGLYGAARGSILRGRVMGLILARWLLRTQAQADIGGQPFEQSTGIARFIVVSFFGLK